MQALRAQKKAARQAAKAQNADGQGSTEGRQAWIQLPTSVNSAQRARVHASAEASGLAHESIDTDKGRALRVGTPTLELVRKQRQGELYFRGYNPVIISGRCC